MIGLLFMNIQQQKIVDNLHFYAKGLKLYDLVKTPTYIHTYQLISFCYFPQKTTN